MRSILCHLLHHQLHPIAAGLAILVSTMVCPLSRSLADQLVVVGYLPDYRINGLTSDKTIGVTHLVYFGISPSKDGKLPEEPISESTLTKLKQLQLSSHCKLILCVGGWGRSDGFPSMAGNVQTRESFVKSLVDYCAQHGFSGIDYDWEHPKGDTEMHHYQLLMQDTKRLGSPKGIEVSVAQAGWQNIGKAGYDAVDRVHLMSYDHGFPQATMPKAMADVERLTTWGCPPEKIAVGIPFYGRNKDGKAKTYAQLIRSDTKSEGDLIEGYAFNSQATVAEKISEVQQRSLAGVMIWELAQDTSNPDQSLLMTIRNAVQTEPSTR
ncbi:glycoside hydrolase family 18 protein [Stieleria sp. JC731]|uniref:glycoside hydrolase family 18 protein n=1 Tax=Pirellulaceae TaxID=2691357 RepID=UPI001E41FB0A|nr:glycoside hydrolase family 18 protein [Stieleria sp. JC731]MCC9599197.1 glycoside hydrolase family 18 protein [Stieleria sp. JC731]